jgi:hypothetical protein
VPHIQLSASFFHVLTGVIGTTITPYMFFWQASQEVEENQDSLAKRSLRDMRPARTPDQYRRLTQLHAAATGVTRHEAPASNYVTSGLERSRRHGGDRRHPYRPVDDGGAAAWAGAARLLFSSSRTACRRPSQPAGDGLDQHHG